MLTLNISQSLNERKKKMKDGKISIKAQTVEAVACSICGFLHNVDSDGFIAVHGNICKGIGGGIIGNNFDENNVLKRSFIFCDSRDCMMEFIGKINTVAHRMDINPSLTIESNSFLKKW